MFAALNSFLTRAVSGYFLNKSLRFRSSASAYLNRTPATATNQKTWTWSGWVKRGALADAQVFGGDNGSSSFLLIQFNTDNLIVVAYGGSGNPLFGFNTSAVFRDPAAWYHVVLAFDTTQATASARARFYVNGIEQSVVARGGYPSGTPALNTDYVVNGVVQHRIGATLAGASYYDGELAEVNFVDGQALAPTAFGAYSIYNQWLPIRYAGTYGTNGFYLPFTNTTTGSSFASYAGTFDGSTQSITAPSNAAFQFTGDFTIECWLYQTASNVGKSFYGCGSSGTTDIQCNIATSSVISFYSPGGGGSAFGITGTTSLAQNTWYHVAITRSGSTVRLFVNGILDATGTSSATMPSVLSAAYVGSYTNYYGNQYWFAGRISNFRIVKGTAVYTSNFIVPTTALTAISGTSLLTLQNATIIDNSTNAFTITNNGTVVTSTQTVATAATPVNLTLDSSGNANNWTPNNISLTAGSTYDSLTDVPTLTSTTVANYAVLNPLDKIGSTAVIRDGNLTFTKSGATYYNYAYGTIGVSSGKYYWEITQGSTTDLMVGITNSLYSQSPLGNNPPGSTINGYMYMAYNGNKYNNATATAYGATFLTANDVIGIALDLTAGTLTYYKNGTSQGVAFSSLPAGTYFPVVSDQGNQITLAYANFGQQPFAYTPPTGFLPLNTFNI